MKNVLFSTIVLLFSINLFAQTEETYKVPYGYVLVEIIKGKQVPIPNQKIEISVNGTASPHEYITDQNGKVTIEVDILNPPVLTYTWKNSAYCGEDRQIGSIQPEDYHVQTKLSDIIEGGVKKGTRTQYLWKESGFVLERYFESSDILFKSGSFEIDMNNQSNQDIIGKMYSFIAQNQKDFPCKKFQIVGHTDTVGAPDKNLALSEKRAEEVLANLGRIPGINFIYPDKTKELFVVDLSTVSSIGKGESDLLIQTNDNVAKKENRRVEIKIID